MFKRVRNKKFDYVPRFYDPVKDDLDTRLSSHQKERMNDTQMTKERIRSGLRARMPGNKAVAKKATLRSNIRLFIIIAILVVLAIKLLQSDFITKMIMTFEG